MKFLIFALIVGLAAAVEDKDATLDEGSKVAEYLTDTGYNFNFKTSNNIHIDESYDASKDIKTGFYEYTSPEGRNIRVDYTAGAGIGFNPRSTPDVIPDEIVKAIELNLKNPPEETKKVKRGVEDDIIKRLVPSPPIHILTSLSSGK